MSQDPRDNILNEKITSEFRNRVMAEAEVHLSENRPARRDMLLSWARNLGLAGMAFWLGSRIISSDEYDDQLVLEALDENEELFLELDDEDFEMLIASEEIDELDEVL